MNELSALIPKFDRMLEMSDSDQQASITTMAADVAKKAAASHGTAAVKLSRLANMLSFVAVMGHADRQGAIKVCVEGLREVVSEARG